MIAPRLMALAALLHSSAGCCESRSADERRSFDGHITVDGAQHAGELGFGHDEAITWLREWEDAFELRVRPRVTSDAPALLIRFDALSGLEAGPQDAAELRATGCTCPQKFGPVGEWVKGEGWTEFPLTCSTDDTPSCATLEGSLHVERWQLDRRCSLGLCLNVLDAQLSFEIQGRNDDTAIEGRVSVLAEDTWLVDESCEGPL